MITIYEKNFNLLTKLIDLDLLRRERYLKYKAGGFMDLIAEYLQKDSNNGSEIISLTHYYTQNHDLIPDPDMELRIYNKPFQNTVEAFTYQDSLSYDQVYSEKYNQILVNTTLKKRLNTFLNQWLRNLRDQGFTLYRKKSYRVLKYVLEEDQEETIFFYWFLVKIIRDNRTIITDYKEFSLKMLDFLSDLKQKKATII